MVKRIKRKRAAKELLYWIKYLAAFCIIAVAVNNFIIVNAVVISSSMETTVMTDSRVMGLRLAYAVKDPKRFDIILFLFPDDETREPFLKRIVGLPNEQVEIKNGKVYINGSDTPLDDHFVKEPPRGNYGPFTVPAGSYFVLGDNRNNSHDSKNWVNKFVARDKILGKVYAEYFPKPKLLE